MAFCKECGKKISDKAEVCPACGVRQKGSSGGCIVSTVPKSKATAVILAVFLGCCTWIYTYKRDAWKFWLGLLLAIFLCWTIVVPFCVYGWAVIDVAVKSPEWYDEY